MVTYFAVSWPLSSGRNWIRRLEKSGHDFEWADVKQDLDSLQEISIDDNGKRLAICSQRLGVCNKVFQATGVAIPQTIREIL